VTCEPQCVSHTQEIKLDHMRNAFGIKNESGFGSESDPRFAERSESPDQLTVVWSSAGEMVVAYPLPNSGAGSSRMDIVRFPSDFDLAAAVNMRRAKETGLEPLSLATHYLTAAADYSERTRILALDGERLAYDDAILLEWLVNAERQMALGTDNHPVFETSLEDTACAIRRLPNGQIAMTEAPRAHMQALGARLRSVLGEHPAAPISLTIETPLRCAARYFLTETTQGGETLRPGRSSEVTAFLLLNRAGYSFGLWSPQAGLFSEYAFLAPDELGRKGRVREQTDPDDASAEGAAAKAAHGLESYIRHAFDQLLLQMSPDKLAGLQLSNYAQVVWAAERGLTESAAPIAAEFADKTGLEFFALNVPADDAVAAGLLLGSYSFGKTSVTGAQNLPQVNLARDILALADTEEIERRREEEARLVNRRNRAAMTMLAAPVIVLAILLALVASILASNLMTAWRESSADTKTRELKPALDRRKSYEANLKWYQEFITEVSQLRRQQPVGIGMLYQLDSSYPFSTDPSFYVSDLKLTPTGDVEIKGLARNKDAVTAFLKALEFAGGPESGSRMFGNLAYEVQETTRPETATQQVKLPSMTGSTLNTAKAAPGVVSWSIKGNYVPMAEFIPKPQPGKPGAPVPPGQQTPAAAPPPAAAKPPQ
jgi:Tfp pilus assembly protein PilN